MVHKAPVFVALIAVAVLAAIPLVIVWPHSSPTRDLAQPSLQTSFQEKVINIEIRLGANTSKVTGASFNADLQSTLQKAINQAAAIYGNDNKNGQVQYISQELYRVMPVNWDVIIASGINTSRFLDLTGVQTPSINGSLYAFWHGVCHVYNYSNYYAYYVIGRNPDLVGPSVILDSSRTNTDYMPSELDSFIRSTNKAVEDTSVYNFNKKVATALYEHNKHFWTVITIPYYYGNKYPLFHARISGLNSARASYLSQFKINKKVGTEVNQIAFFYYGDY